MTHGRIAYSSKLLKAELFSWVTSRNRRRHQPTPTYKNMVINCRSKIRASSILFSPFWEKSRFRNLEQNGSGQEILSKPFHFFKSLKAGGRFRWDL